jgi:ATP-binding cassette subfamily B multidrug efflux pump
MPVPTKERTASGRGAGPRAALSGHRGGQLRRLVGFLRPYRGLSALALLTLTALVGLDLAIPRLIQHIIDEGIGRRDSGVVVRTALLMLGISALSALIAVGNNAFSVRVGEAVARDMREALFLRIQSYSFGDLDRQNTGQLMVRLTSDVSAVRSLTQISLRIGTRAPMLMLGSLALMIATSVRLALTMLPLLAVTTALIVLFVGRMERLFQAVQARLDRLNTLLQENIAGVRVVKAFVRERHEGERFEGANQDVMERSIEVMRFTAAMTPLLTLCVNVGMCVVIWSGGREAIRGELSVGQIVAFTNYMLTTMTPLVMMSMLASIWAAGASSLRRLEANFTTVPEVQDAPGAPPLPADAAPRVGFAGVSFSYRGEEAVLRDVELALPPGRTVAILGATGAGKSTLVNLIPRFYDATSGTVSFGGCDVRAVTQASLLEHIAMVPQESILFTGTVRDNIRYGKPDAGDDEVVAAARDAQAHDFIARLPEGYDAHVEQRGANFSGGQRQRLAIARALLLRPRALLLDDATSAVDVETETRIQRALAERLAGTTVVVVAQRISTVLGADHIVVLDKGRVVAQGTHRELLEASEVYREIYDSQLGAVDAGSLRGAEEAGA